MVKCKKKFEHSRGLDAELNKNVPFTFTKIDTKATAWTMFY